MLSKRQIKQLRSLHDKKYRQKYDLFVVEGEKAVREFLTTPHQDIQKVYGRAGWLDKNKDFLAPSEVEHEPVTERELRQISALTTPQQVLATVRMPAHKLDHTLLHHTFTLGVDRLNDPGNLGTIIRIADWYGIGQVLCSRGTVDAYNPKVVQAAMGSLARVQVHRVVWEEVLDRLPEDFPVYGATLDGDNVHEMERVETPGLLLIGSEAHGLEKALLQRVHRKLSIPRRGKAESLNAAVAAAVLCDNLLRGKD